MWSMCVYVSCMVYGENVNEGKYLVCICEYVGDMLIGAYVSSYMKNT